MPELPEVEVLRRSLLSELVGRTVENVNISRTDLRDRVDPSQLVRAQGRKIVDLRRRAKYLLVDLEQALTLVVHLGMTGQLTLVDSSTPRARHEHLSFDLGTSRLRYVDPRRFGLVMALDTARLDSDRHFNHLGIEPLSVHFSAKFLKLAVGRRNTAVKPFIMDSTVVVGVGNIYASEALFLAGIHPKRKVSRVSIHRWEQLVTEIRSVLSKAIERGGTSFSDFVDGYGRRGRQKPALAVYGRENEPCPRCQREIRRFTQAGRSTFYCPGCQT